MTLTAPANAAQYAAPATITLSATASSSDSTISRVEFYQGTTLIGSATAAPYTALWSNVPLGSYSLTAKAVDAAGIETYSAAVAVTVSAPGAKLYYLHTDQLDTPRLVTDETNTIVWRNAPLSEPFGLATPEEDPDGDGQTFTMNLRFPGQVFDKETNTNYNYFRDYNPELGRYIQSDPIGLRGGVNTFTYVNGKPLSYVDPTGEMGLAQVLAIGTAIYTGYKICEKGYDIYKDWDAATKSVDNVIEKTKASQEEMKKCVSTGACENLNKALSDADEAKRNNMDAARQLGKDATNAIPDLAKKVMK